MENLIIEPTDKTPLVEFNSNSGIMKIKGKSIPEDTFKFYQQLNDWIKKYLQFPAAITTFKIELDYFNTSSAKRLLSLFVLLQEAVSQRKTMGKVQWFYEKDDADSHQAGVDFTNLISLRFEFIELNK